MSHNPYAAPRAAIDARAHSGLQAAGPRPLYSPTQVALGAFLGGPMGVVYFLHANFRTLGEQALATRTWRWGAAFMIAWVAIVPLLPERFPSTPLTIAYVIVARQVSEKHQMTKQAIADSPFYAFHSNWRVFGLSLLCFLVSLIALLVPTFALAWLGWDPMGLMA